MPTSNPRKRPAPGTVPIPQPQPMAQTYNTPDPLLRWNGNNAGNFVGNTSNNVNPYGMMSSPTQAQFPQGAPTPSNALARRGMNSALVTANRQYSPQPNDSWANFAEEALTPTEPNGGVDEHDNIEVLEEKAQRARRDAQAKRKQIPPFVQKLNSFLEQSRNTDLIRWSERGDSFIVLDEDEFAKTLIPELFKHNNYASFVRQLNMYGFHKKVGLSDNSMKASERKNKSPSEYYNPYFKRGHPNLLWLINKPKSGTAKKGVKKRGDEVEVESDDEILRVDDPISNSSSFNRQNVPNLALPAPEPRPLQNKELAVVRDQMSALQQRQKQISDAISRLRQDHNQLYNQAIAFQEMHSRHENSITAILNFLANVFRKSLEEQGGTQNVNDLLASIIPNVPLPTQGQGSVVDLGDEWVQQQMPANPTQLGTPKRTQRLLPPIPEKQAGRPSSASSPSAAFPNYASHQQPQAGQVTELYDTPPDSAPTPAYLKQELDTNPHEGMLKIIQDANTHAGKTGNTPIDLSNVAANTSMNMTNDQRNRMLSIMSGGRTSAFQTPTPSAASPAAPTPTGTAANNPGVPLGGDLPDANKSSSLSPIMPSAQPPSIQRIAQNAEELERLQRLQHEQSQNLDDLSQMLGPLSPSGRIPGLDESNAYFGDDIDLSQYLDPNAYTADGTGNDFNFDTPAFDDSANLDWNPDMTHFGGGLGDSPNAGRVVETNTPSPSGTEEIPRDDLAESPDRPAKRQRQS
ncbi:Uu.00g069040.m01.CDS01 [Anthostomella pinea]|uniref:Uu.00g069040.m01.CDS01 n=1 Tax=Anthostomella pinea TaxID=933095 RepID=A0AAI8VV86_9PEZI|nr:Uu.00g069040.m01.CDS01 [Anthostomella pinea]